MLMQAQAKVKRAYANASKATAGRKDRIFSDIKATVVAEDAGYVRRGTYLNR